MLYFFSGQQCSANFIFISNADSDVGYAASFIYLKRQNVSLNRVVIIFDADLNIRTWKK